MNLLQARNIFSLLFLPPLLLSGGCALFIGQPSEEELHQTAEVKVVTPVDFAGAAGESTKAATKSAPPPQQNLGPLYAPLIAANFEAGYTAELRDQGGSDVQRLAMCRAEARRGALRKLAANITASTPQGPDGPTMQKLIAQNAVWAARIGDGLDQSAAIEMTETPTAVQARATITGQKVAEMIGVTGAQRVETAAAEPIVAGSSALEEARAAAQSQALDTARLRLYEMLLLDGKTGQALSAGVKSNPQLEVGLRSMINKLQPSKVRFTDDNKCELTLGVQRQRAYQLLTRYE